MESALSSDRSTHLRDSVGAHQYPGGPRSQALLLLLLILVPLTGWCQGTTPDDVKALATTTNPSNMHLNRSLAQQAVTALGSKAYNRLVIPTNPISQTGPSLNNIARQAVEAQKKYDAGYMMLKSDDLLVKGSIGAGFILAPATGGTSLAVAAVSQGISLGLDQVEDAYKKAAIDSIRRNLRTQLDQYATRYGQDAYLSLTSSKDPAQFRQELETKIGGIFGSELDNLPQEQQDIVNHFYERQIADLMDVGFSKLSDFQALQQNEIDQNRKDIKGLALAFSQFADSTTDQLNNIFKTQKDLVGSLQSLNRCIGNTEQGVAFMQNVMFSNMKPAEQLAALRAGLFPDMPVDQRKDLEDKIAVVAKRQELADNVATYLTGASELANLAKNLGVDPGIVNVANTAIGIGNQALNAFTAFSSGNVLAGLSSVSNIFGIGGPDVAAERHQQIMNVLGSMYTKLDVIDKKLDALLDGQKLIVQTQQAILENLTQLSQQVQQNQEQLLAQLHDIHADILVNRQIIVDQASLHYGNCFELVKNAADGSVIIDTAKGKYPTWAQFQKLYTNRFNKLDKCTGQLGDTRGANQDFQSVFWLSAYKDTPESNVDAYVKNVYNPAWTLLQSTALKSDGKSIDQRVSSLLSPMNTVTDLIAKSAIVEAVNPPRFRKSLAELMTRPLAPAAILVHDMYMADIHYYYTLLDAHNQPRPLSDLYSDH